MKPISMGGPLSNMVLLPDPGFDKDYGDMLLSMCIKVLAQALTDLPAFYFSVLPRLRSADSSVTEEQASFATRICEAEASRGGSVLDKRVFSCYFDEPSVDFELSNTTDDFLGSEERSEVNCTIYGEAVQGPDMSKRMPQKDISAWLALAKNKDDDDEDEDEEDEDDEEDDDDEAADEEEAGDEGEGEEGVEGHGGGGGEDDDDDDDDDNDDENGKGDEEDNEDAVEAEDDEDEDAAEDDEDDDEEDDDDETPEPPQKKRK